MNKRNKKISMGTLSTLVVITPIVAAVSCGGAKTDKRQTPAEIGHNIAVELHKVIQDYFWNAKIDKHPINKQEEIVEKLAIDKNGKNLKDIQAKIFSLAFRTINRRISDAAKNGFLYLTDIDQRKKIAWIF